MKLIPNNWLYNAGLVGLLRILEAKGIDVETRLSDNSFELCAEDLEGFADVYFKCVLETSLERFIPSLSSSADRKDRDLVNSFGINYVEMRTAKLQQMREELRTKTSVKQAEQSIKDAVHTFASGLERSIRENFEEQKTRLAQNKPSSKTEQKATEKQLKELEKNYERTKKAVDKIRKATDSLEKQKYVVDALKRFYFNKDTIANPSLTKGRGRLEQFEERFVNPACDLLNRHNMEDNSGLICKFCGCNCVSGKLSTKDKPSANEQRLKDMVFNEGMFSIAGVSVEQFPNFFYNLIPDLFVCGVCELVLLCAWAGFNQIPWRLRSGNEDTEYLFVNLPSLPLLFEQNNRVRAAYEQAQIQLQDTIYEDVMADLFSEERRRRGQWVLQNILFVEIRTVPSKQRDKPTFKYFHVGKDVAELFTKPEASNSLRRISGRLIASGWLCSGPLKLLSLQLKREVVKRLLTGDQIYDLAHQVCRQSLDTQGVQLKSVLEMVFLHSLRRQIWHKYRTKDGTNPQQRTSKGGIMEPRQVYGVLRGFYKTGQSLAQAVTRGITSPEEKLKKCQRMAYRLMSIVRSGKYAEFYDMLMKLYVDSQRPIPHDLLSLLNPNDAIEFESKAYALLSGFLGEGQPMTVAGATVPESAIAEDQEISSEEGGNNG